MDIFEAMNTAQAIRQFKPDPVPEETVREMIFYATCPYVAFRFCDNAFILRAGS